MATGYPGTGPYAKSERKTRRKARRKAASAEMKAPPSRTGIYVERRCSDCGSELRPQANEAMFRFCPWCGGEFSNDA